MADAAITFLLVEVKEVIRWHSKLIAGSENEFMELRKDLEELEKFFVKASINDSTTMTVTLSLMDRQIIDVVFEIEGAIQDYLSYAARRKIGAIIRRSLHLNRFSYVAKTVRQQRKKKLIPVIVSLRQDLSNLPTVDQTATSNEGPSSIRFTRGKSKSIWQEKVVAFKDVEQNLLDELTKKTDKLGVMTIYGIDGSGKTTLAKKIFENEKILLEFPSRIWISGSNIIRDVYLSILKRFIGGGDDMSNSSDSQLVRAVSLCLAKEKFLLVIDDLRSSEVWTAVEKELARSNALGKVLITTRDLSMAKDASSSVGPKMLRPLTYDESLELLKVNLKGRCSTPELVDGEKIAEVCRGLPLAVVVIGGSIADADMFMKKIENKNAKCIPESEQKLLRKVVKLSYGRLPGYLKACFLHLAVFPEDQYYNSIIPTQTLKQLWIGEGFIPSKEGKTLEETAEDCLNELIWRNLVMVDSVNPVGEVKTCRVHNVIRDFAKSQALERNFFQEIIAPNQRELVELESTRLCLHFDLNKFLSTKPSLGKEARSLYCFHSDPVRLDPKFESIISDAFKSLRVLDSKFTEFPAWLTKLIHLRYVTLRIAALTVVPETISKLFSLQTLVVETKSRSVTMKANIWRMHRLRHLQTKAAIVMDAKRDGKAGESLQTVGRLSPESCADVSERAPNLKKLAIRGKLAIIFKNMSFLQKLKQLEKLELVNDDMAPSNVDLPPLPNFPLNLKKLTLSNTFLKWERMLKVAEIQTLEVLKLKDNAFTGIHWNAVNCHFPKLQFLLIANTDLVHWEATDESFPQLGSLVIKKCENLNEIPKAVFKELTKLEIERVGKYAVQSAMEIAKSKASMGFKLSVC